ncbi:MAG: MurR/RpiR family transcriptional regulator [Clostridiales bacterium]|jgi:DNA-binding MurR/RpiR family transcriptional regulator|nr:MurR/RpiR family transcriptional regulator [Clostridiales bacterium]
MEKDVLSVIANNNIRYSKGQRLIAKYILENYDKAAFMTAGKLGATVGVSESTVVRFAAELGYDGYPGMRKALQEMIRNRLTSVQRIEVAKELIHDSNVLKAVLTADMEKLQKTVDEIDTASFDAAVNAIINANHVYIVGMRSSAALSSFMGYYLNLLRENVHLLNDTAVSEVYEQVIRIGEGDVFIGMSYPRYSSRTVKAMRFAKKAGATTISLTDGETSPLIKISDITLFARSDMVSFLDSLVAPLSLINALIVSIGLRSEEALSDTFKRLENVWTENDVYENTAED